MHTYDRIDTSSIQNFSEFMIKTGDTILFQGDSITSAFRKPEEINLSFQLGAGYPFLAAATLLLEHPRLDLKFLNRGVNGNTVSDLLARWQVDCIDLKPDVVSFLAGVNDTLRAIPAEQMACDYRTLLEWTRRELPAVRLIMLEPFLIETGEITSQKIADLALRQKIIRQLAEEFGALFVPLQTPLSEAAHRNGAELYSYDGIHPSPAGAALIARIWTQMASPEFAKASY